MRGILVSLIAIFALACSTPADEVVGEPPPTEENAPSARATNIKLGSRTVTRNDQPEALMTVTGWPFNEEGNTFKLTWGGKRTTLGLVDKPTLNGEVIDTLRVDNGEEIIWNNTAVAVFAPSVWRVKKPVLVEGYRWSDDYRTGGDLFSREIGPGTKIKLYHYSGQGLCILEVKGMKVEALCPDQEHYEGVFQAPTRAAIYQPRESLWWVRMRSTGGGGWFPLDDRVIVDIEN